VFSNLVTKKGLWQEFSVAWPGFLTVDREVWLAKSSFYGIHGTDANWFRSYLTDERKEVETKPSNDSCNFFSGRGRIRHGVLQGSILGSILFIIYRNELLLTRVS
jgi:hypothetical protein